MEVFTRGIFLLCFIVEIAFSGTVNNENFEVLLETPSTKYIVSNETADPESASEICNSRRGHLLAIESMEENLLISEKLRELGIPSIWLSGIEFSNSSIANLYFWSSTGDRFQYYNFHDTSKYLARSIRNKRSPPIDDCPCECDNWPLLPFKKPVCNQPKCRITDKGINCVKKPFQTCSITEDPLCRTKRGECRVECGTEKCQILPPVCTIKSEKPRCYLKTPAECEPTRSKCKIVAGECRAHRDCSIDNSDACKIVTKPCENPCTQPNCESITPPCISKPTPCVPQPNPCESPNNCTKPSVPDNCKNSTTYCQPSSTVCSRPFVDCSPEICQSTVQICKPPRVVCRPLQFICDPPKIDCENAKSNCPEPEVVCEDPEYDCSQPIIKCPDAVVHCEPDVTICDPASHSCETPQGTCDDEPKYTCEPPNICELYSSTAVGPKTTNQTGTDVPMIPKSGDCNKCCRRRRRKNTTPSDTETVETKKCVAMKKDLGFKWETQSCNIKDRFVCEERKIAERSLFDFMI